MRLKFSEPNHPAGRHIVLIAEPDEVLGLRATVKHEILQNKVLPEEQYNYETGRTRFRFAMRFLDRILLCLPQLDLSDGIRQHLSDLEQIRLDSFPKPKIEWPLLKKKAKFPIYQQQGAACIVSPSYARSCGFPSTIPYLNDGLGLGKSYQAALAMAFLLDKARRKGKKFPILVVCPNNVKVTWVEDVIRKNFRMSAACITAKMSYAQRQALIDSQPDVIVVNFEAIRATPVHKDDNPKKKIIGWKFANPALFLKDWHRSPVLMDREVETGSRNLREWGLTVIDEYHTVKNPYALATRGFLQLRSKKWLMMSATPILSRPDEIWTTLHKLYPKSFVSYDSFVKQIGGRGNRPYNVDAMAALRGFLMEISLRRRKEHISDQLPKTIIVPRLIEMTKEQRKLYDRIEEKLELELADGTVSKINHALPAITRLKQACFSPELYEGSIHSAKIEELKKIVAELVAEGEKAVIFSQWSKATRIIQRELKEYNPAYVTGEIKDELARQREIRRFNKDPNCKLYIGTVKANAEGVNLGAATYVIFTDVGWVPGKDVDQPIGRSAAGGLRGAAFGPDQKVHVIMLRIENTIEQWVDSILDRKRGTFDRMIERDGGAFMEKLTTNDLARLIRKGRQLREAA